MINLKALLDVPKDLILIATVIPKVQAAIPQIEKTIADFSTAAGDQKDPVKLISDIKVILDDIKADLALLNPSEAA